MAKDRGSRSQANMRQASLREAGSIIKIEVTTALKDALEYVKEGGPPQVVLYKDKPIVILRYDDYEQRHEGEEEFPL